MLHGLVNNRETRAVHGAGWLCDWHTHSACARLAKRGVQDTTGLRASSSTIWANTSAGPGSAHLVAHEREKRHDHDDHLVLSQNGWELLDRGKRLIQLGQSPEGVGCVQAGLVWGTAAGGGDTGIRAARALWASETRWFP